MLQIEFFQRNLQNLEKNWKKMTLCQLEIGTFKRNLRKRYGKKGSNNLQKLMKSPAKLCGFWKCQSKKKKKLILRQSCTEVQKRTKPLQRAGPVMLSG